MHNFTCLRFDSTGTDVTDFDDFWEPSDSVYVVGLRYDFIAPETCARAMAWAAWVGSQRKEWVREMACTEERLPQRFKWRDAKGESWQYGVCFPRTSEPGYVYWAIHVGVSIDHFDSDPWETLGQVLGDVHEFHWIDNDYGWHPVEDLAEEMTGD